MRHSQLAGHTGSVLRMQTRCRLIRSVTNCAANHVGCVRFVVLQVEAAGDAALEGDDDDQENEQQHANHAAISRLRTMVASLKEGVAFCKRLAASLRQLQVLLTSPKADVVHDAIVFLTLCK